MTTHKKTILGMALAMALAAAANAAPITVGGVTWDPDSPLDWTATSANVRQFVNQTTGAVSGYGIITTLNGTGIDTFCPGCYLTFQYTSYTSTTGTPAVGSTENHTGGSLSFYTVNRGAIDPNNILSLNWTNTTSSNLWLSTVGSGTTSWTYGNGGGGKYSAISGGGLLAVSGGAAMANFNTNTFGSGADLNFTTSLAFDQGGTGRTTPWDWSGTGNFSGDSVAGNNVPEPGTLALAGLGLLGLGVLRRRQVATR